jgi:Tol biopolymer transport system component
LSPDEKKVAVTELNTAVASTWIYDVENKVKSRLSFTGGAHMTPTFSPDGKEVAFTANQQAAISVKALGSSAPDRELLTDPKPVFQAVTDWSRDGRYLMYSRGLDLNLQLWILPLFGDRKPFTYTQSTTTVQERGGVFSPDGKWVAYMSDEGGRPELFVAPFPWTGAKWQVSNGGGVDPHWRQDGKELYYFNFTGIAAAAVDGSGSAFQVGASKLLFRVPVRGIGREFVPSHDGQKFLAIVPNGGTSQLLTLVQNWPAELKRK